jgi:hypothetical protein
LCFEQIIKKGPYEVNESYDLNRTGVSSAILWLKDNASPNSTIASNSYFMFPFYLNMKTGFKLDHLIHLPGYWDGKSIDIYREFVEHGKKGTIDYLVVFFDGEGNRWRHIFGYLEKGDSGPYLLRYSDPEGNFKIYSPITSFKNYSKLQSKLYQGWSKNPNPSYQTNEMSISYTKVQEGLKVNIKGTSMENSSDSWMTFSVRNKICQGLNGIYIESQQLEGTIVQVYSIKSGETEPDLIKVTSKNKFDSYTSYFENNNGSEVEYIFRIQAVYGGKVYGSSLLIKTFSIDK